MTKRPVAAGKSSLDHVDQDLAFGHIISPAYTRYLDLACGAGRYTLALAQRLDNKRGIHAFDLWEDGIATLRQSAKEQGFENIQAQVVDMTGPLPLADGSIDACLIATALHDIDEAKRNHVVGEVHRVLAPHGALLLIEFKKSDQGPGPRKERRIGEQDADALVLPHGFTKDVCVSLGEYPYLAKYIKS